ncbi:MAG TPA: VanZ family protein [Clostridia bacterium]|nr:VanZ family protein [Clostridia bacterium]
MICNKHSLLVFIRITAAILLCAYLIFIAWRMFFYAFGSYYRTYSALPEYNLIPFKTIINLIVNFRYYELDVWIYNLFGNLAAFIPLGLLLPAAIGVKRKFRATVIFSVLLLLTAETAQLMFRVGVFDVDDIILNMIGVVSGYMVYILILKLNRIK